MGLKTKVAVLTIALCLCSIGVLAGCQPKAASGPDVQFNSYEGSYDVYEPDFDRTSSGGKSIQGSDEENLQQERIAGGAVGKVVSKNLEPLEGIVNGDDTQGANFGMWSQPPDGHGLDEGCVNCHDPEKVSAPAGTKVLPMPKSHQGIGLDDDDCRSCHSPAKE